MIKKDLDQARKLVDKLVKQTRAGTPAHQMAVQLEKLLQPTSTLGDIIALVPGENHKEKAELIGLSRQGYYNLVRGLTKPHTMTARRLAELTGISEDIIRQAGT